jgi:hypothetical protein
MKRPVALALALVLLLPGSVWPAEEKAAPGDIRVKGTRIAPGEQDNSGAVAHVGKRGIMGVLSEGVDNWCARDSLSVAHEEASFQLDGQTFDAAAFADHVATRADGIRCIVLTGERAGQADMTLLQEKLVTGLGLTIQIKTAD